MGRLESMRTLIGCQSLAGSLFAVLAIGYFHAGLTLLAWIYLCGSLLLLLLFIPTQQLPSHRRRWLLASTFLLYTLIAILLLASPEYLTSLNTLSLYLAFPVLVFSLLPFRAALLLVLGFALISNLLGMLFLEGTLRASFLTAFWLITLLTTVHSFTHQQRQQDLKAYLSKDPNTGLFNQQLLFTDLHKEVERARRERTQLALLRLEGGQLTQADTLARLQALEQAFAPYERLYQGSDHHLVVLLPLGQATQLDERLEQLADHLSSWRISALVCDLQLSAQGLLQALETQAGDQAT